MFYHFLVELLTYYDITKFHGHWSSNREVTQGAESPPLAVLDSKKPGLFRVKGSPILPHSVQSRGSPEPRSHNGPKLVGTPPTVSQQNTNSYKRPRSHHHIRCLRSELGSMVQGKITSRPVVSGGNILAYKPKGTSSCIFGSKNILPISNTSVVPHSSSNRQSGSCFIYINHLGEHTQNFFAN